LTRGLSREEADRVVSTMTEEFPEMTETQVYEFLLDEWRGLDDVDEILAEYR
jgi:hypothetical protein